MNHPSIDAVVRRLDLYTGTWLISWITGRHRRTVRRWMHGEQQPQIPTEILLRDVLQVLDYVAEREGLHTARAWFVGMNELLDDFSPAHALHDGVVDGRQIMKVARADWSS